MNCAVTISSNEKLVDTSISTIEKEIGTNIMGSFYTIKEFLPGMQRLKRGHIVTVSSALGYCGPARLCISQQTLVFNSSRLLYVESRFIIPP